MAKTKYQICEENEVKLIKKFITICSNPIKTSSLPTPCKKRLRNVPRNKSQFVYKILNFRFFINNQEKKNLHISTNVFVALIFNILHTHLVRVFFKCIQYLYKRHFLLIEDFIVLCIQFNCGSSFISTFSTHLVPSTYNDILSS